MRFDDVSDPAQPKPLANLVNYSLHPEFLERQRPDLGRLRRRRCSAWSTAQTGGLTIFTQNAVGTAEPERSTYHSIHERLEFTHREYAQAEYGARLMSDAIVDTWRDVERQTPERSDKFVPFQDDAGGRHGGPVVPGTHVAPLPRRLELPRRQGVRAATRRSRSSACPTATAASAVLQSLASLFGLPEPPDPPIGAGRPRHLDRRLPGARDPAARELLGAVVHRAGRGRQRPPAGLPPGRHPLHRLLLRAVVRPVAQHQDAHRHAQGNEHHGYDWAARCTYNGDVAGTWTCPNPRNPSTNLPPISTKNFLRMKAQVNNDANGWNDLSNILWAESEPTDPTRIKGNYTHAELPPGIGYRLTVPISMANDYNGYIASYREYQRGDHYRKALTAWGPHSSDYMATRLVGMGGELNGGPLLPDDIGQEKVAADLALNDQRADKLGEIGETSVTAYEAALPDDGGDGARASSSPRTSSGSPPPSSSGTAGRTSPTTRR